MCFLGVFSRSKCAKKPKMQNRDTNSPKINPDSLPASIQVLFWNTCRFSSGILEYLQISPVYLPILSIRQHIYFYNQI